MSAKSSARTYLTLAVYLLESEDVPANHAVSLIKGAIDALDNEPRQLTISEDGKVEKLS